MSNPTFIGLINNTALLLALGVLYGFLQRRAETIGWKLFSGFVLGVVSIGLMMNPWQLAPGVFFDTRTILLSVGGLFLGYIPMIPALALGSLYRAYVGGPGTLTGILWILFSGGLGIAWARIGKRPACQLSAGEFYLFGVMVQTCMLLLMLTMPDNMGFSILQQISLPVMFIFPLGTVLLAKLLAAQELQQRGERELDASERKYRELVGNAQAIILGLDIQGQITFLNQFALDFFGYPEEEILGQNVVGTIIPTDESALLELEAIRAEIRSDPEEATEHENDNICHDGRRVRVLWKNKPVLNAAGEIIGIQSVGHDLTEQRRAEAALQATEQQFHRLIEVSPIPLVFLNNNHTLTYLNGCFTETFGYTLRDLATLDDWWEKAFPATHYRNEIKKKWDDAAIRATALKQDFIPQEARVTRKDGTVLDIVSMMASIGEREIIVLNDMTKERQLARSKSEFIATAAHELNTPLTSVSGFTELLLDNVELDRATQQEYLRIILNKTEVLEKIITDLLELSRYESGQKIRLEKGLDDLRSLIVQTLNAARHEFDDRRFDLDWPEPGPGQTSFDRFKLGQVLENLLSNAIKFSPPGSTIRVQGTQTAAELRVSISNRGAGMNAEQIEHAFERFYRADTSNTAVAGLGLGLPIAQGIIAAHGGTIHLDSQPGQETRVSFTLPRTD